MELGAKHGYHVNTFGFLIGELVRRVSGETVGAFVRRTIAGPLNADFHFGIGADEDPRVADFVFPHVAPEFIDPGTPLLVRQTYLNPPGLSGLGTVNTRAWRAAEMPSTNAHATARGVARIYSALAGAGGRRRSPACRRDGRAGRARGVLRPGRGAESPVAVRPGLSANAARAADRP